MTEAIARYFPQFIKMPELAWSPIRGRDRPDLSLELDGSNLARHWAGVSTGKYNQDVSVMIEGPKGTGKSFTGLSLAINSAKWQAEFLGTNWRDHFDIERTCAIVDTEKADDVMMNSERYDVRLFDDISLAWGARNWQSEENKDKNDIYIINRIDNTINILTSPNSKLIDVVPRSNVNYKGEMDTPYFNFGYSSLKIFKPIPIFRAASYKALDPFMRSGRDKFVVYMIEAPPKRAIDLYNVERRKATEKIKKIRRERLNDKREGRKPSSSNKVQSKSQEKHKKTIEMEQRINGYLPRWHEIRKAGGSDKDIQNDARLILKVPRDTWKRWKDSGLLHSAGVLQDHKMS